MVGTRPMMQLSVRAWRAVSFIQAMVRMVSKGCASALGRGSRGTLAIEMHQVGEYRLRAELAKQRGDLPAMIGSVIDHVLHGLPQGIAIGSKFERAIFEEAVQILLREAVHKGKQGSFLGQPVF